MAKREPPPDTRHLDAALKIFKAPKPSRPTANMRPQYEAALRLQGWEVLEAFAAGSIWAKGKKRMRVENGDRLTISFDGVKWTLLNPSARQRLLLHSQV